MAEDEILPEEYDVEERDVADLRAFGIDPAVGANLFSNLVDEAVIHAADAARRDGQAAALAWMPLGPRNVGGRIRAITQDPLTPRTIYAGSAFGGLWKSDNGGDTWRPLNTFLEPDADPAQDKDVALPVGAIGICHRTPQTLYIGTGEPVAGKFSGTGLYMSTDSGTSFTRIDALDGTGQINALRYERIEVDPWLAGRCWMACPRGLWRREPTIAAPGPNIIQDVIDDPSAPPVQNVTDVVIDFGDRTQAAAPGNFTVYVGLRANRKNMAAAHPDFATILPGGIFRAVFDPVANNYVTPASGQIWTALTDPNFPFPVLNASGTPSTTRGRIKLALCERQSQNVYAVVGLTDHKASNVFHSADGGNSWRQTALRTEDDGAQAYYDLLLAVHPDDPGIYFTGSIDVFRTVDNGASWDKVLNWHKYDTGDRAQHADQHGFFFDRRDPRRVWVSNDGGISESRNLGNSWRKRSHGILATQFYDLTIHQTYPFIMGGGLQDNGSWVTFGGTTWHPAGGGDGGGLAFQADATDVLITNWQGPGTQPNSVRGTNRVQANLTYHDTLRPVSSSFANRLSWLADQPTTTGASGETRYPYLSLNSTQLDTGWTAGHHALFGGKMEAHPLQADHFLAARRGAAYNVGSGTISADPATISFSQLTTGAFTPANAEVSALAYAPSPPPQPASPNSDNIWWVGTTGGELFFTTNAGGLWHDATTTLPAPAPNEISDITVHPRTPNIVVITVARRTNNVLISANAQSLDGTGAPNATWRAISHASGTGAGSANRDLPRAPVTRVVIDPTSADTISADPSDAANFQILYLATIAGVYVCRNATVDPGVAPLWFTLNENMPLVLLRDLVLGQSYALDGTTVTRSFLRAGTYGRGVYECDLGGTPVARLMIRNAAIDDSHSYFGDQAINHDPRLNVPTAAAPAPLDLSRSIDIRIDPPPYSYFEDVIDGVEFDEDLRGDTLVLGDRNFVYVQVHTRGSAMLDDVDVSLYFAEPTGTPALVPNLDNDFWTQFPAEPAAGAVWQRAGQVRVDQLHSGQPRVARFEWVPPTTLGANVALLALVTSGDDDLAAVVPAPSLVVQPGGALTTLMATERRAALFVTPTRRVAPDVYVRDGVGDTGEPGAVAWGGRSADIVVVEAPEANPDQAFGSLADARSGDRIRAGQTNHVYVRVFNRSAAQQSATVDLFFVPYAALADPSAWTQIGAQQAVAEIPAGGHLFSAVFTWAAGDIPDPAPGSDIKAHILVALIGSGEDPAPDRNTIDSLAAFWDFFLAAERANNACFRAVRYLPD